MLSFIGQGQLGQLGKIGSLTTFACQKKIRKTPITNERCIPNTTTVMHGSCITKPLADEPHECDENLTVFLCRHVNTDWRDLEEVRVIR